MTEWYYSDAQRTQHGPVTAADLAALHSRGQLPPDALVWRDGMTAWRPWQEMMREVITGGAPDDPQAEAFVRAAEAAPADGAYRPYAIAEASPYAPPQARLEQADDVVRGGRIVYAGFWKRFAAYVIDGFVVGAVNYAIAIPISLFAAVGLGASATPDNPFGSGAAIALIGVMYLIQILLPGIYFGWMQSSRHQASLGKMAIGIKVTRGDGAPIQFWRGFGRYYATILSSLILLIGFIMAGFTERKQALHDMICDTLVVDKYAFTDHPEWQREELGTVTIVVLALSGLMALGLIALFAVLGAVIAGGIR